METRPKKGLWETTKNLGQRVVCNEDEVVRDFLAKSENYQALKKIKNASEASKNGAYKNWSLIQFGYQIHSSEEKQIGDLETAKTFAEVLHIIGIPLKDFDKTAIEPVMSAAGNVWQKANTAYYMFRLAIEAKECADAKFYDVSTPSHPHHRF